MAKEAEKSEKSRYIWRNIAEYLKNVVSLERSVRQLTEENEQLRNRIDDLQRAVDDHNGQLKVILTTLDRNISDSVEAAAERAAVETITKLLLEPPEK